MAEGSNEKLSTTNEHTLLLLVMSEEESHTKESPSIGHAFFLPINMDYEVRYRHQSPWCHGVNGTVYSLMAVLRRTGDRYVTGDELIKASAITPGRIFTVVVPAGRLVTIYSTDPSIGFKDFLEIDWIPVDRPCVGDEKE